MLGVQNTVYETLRATDVVSLEIVQDTAIVMLQ